MRHELSDKQLFATLAAASNEIGQPATAQLPNSPRLLLHPQIHSHSIRRQRSRDARQTTRMIHHTKQATRTRIFLEVRGHSSHQICFHKLLPYTHICINKTNSKKNRHINYIFIPLPHLNFSHFPSQRKKTKINQYPPPLIAIQKLLSSFNHKFTPLWRKTSIPTTISVGTCVTRWKPPPGHRMIQ
jgi:hypothetical protein